MSVVEPQCPACGGAVVPPGASYMGTLTVCRCTTATWGGTQSYRTPFPSGPIFQPAERETIRLLNLIALRLESTNDALEHLLAQVTVWREEARNANR